MDKPLLLFAALLPLTACNLNSTISKSHPVQKSLQPASVSPALPLKSTAPSPTPSPSPSPAPVQHLNEVAADLDAFLNYLPSHWANREFNEKLDSYSLDTRISDLKSDLLARPPQTDSEFFSRIDLFLRRLHDGHMAISVKEGKPYRAWRSGLHFEFGKEGVLLTSYDASDPYTPYQDLDLPVVVTKIDNIPSLDWITSRADTETGTMAWGRRQAALLSLSFTGYRLRGEYEPARVFTIVTPAGTEVTLRMDWFDVTPDFGLPKIPGGYAGPLPLTEYGLLEPRCVFAQRDGATLVLRVQTFECTRKYEEPSAVKDARFVKQLEEALATQPNDFQSVLIDLRNNGGGSDVETRALGAKFLSAPAFWYRISSLTGDTWRAPFLDTFTPPTTGTPDLQGLKTKPLWLLTNGGCFSACSMFVRELHDAGRAKVIGTPMDGGVGGPRPWSAPSGLWQVSVPSVKLWNQDGSPMEGTTVLPDVSIIPDLDDFRRETDPTLTDSLRAIGSQP